MLERREAYGFMTPVIRAGAGVKTPNINGLLGMALGFIYGLQWNQVAFGQCYTSLDSSVLIVQEMLVYMSHIYLPQNWGNLLVAARDATDIVAAVYANCNI